MMTIAACMAVAVLAAGTVAADGGATNAVQAKSGKALFLKNTGGFVRKPGSSSGRVVFVDAQSRFPRSEVAATANAVSEELRIDVVCVGGSAGKIDEAVAAVGAAGGAAGVVVAALDRAWPVLMVFPDERCAVVNVAAMPDGADAGLLRKQVARGFAAASGAMSSQVTLSLMSAFENQRKLESFPTEKIPADVGVRVKTALRLAGVTPYMVTTYKRACQEGWAPAPTNDVQKAIWDKVHAMPSKPMKIEFDPKKGR